MSGTGSRFRTEPVSPQEFSVEIVTFAGDEMTELMILSRQIAQQISFPPAHRPTWLTTAILYPAIDAVRSNTVRLARDRKATVLHARDDAIIGALIAFRNSSGRGINELAHELFNVKQLDTSADVLGFVGQAFRCTLTGVSPVTSLWTRPGNEEEVRGSSAIALGRTLCPTAPSVRMLKSTTVQATVEWIEGRTAVLRFEHPALGAAEREFALEQLPSNISAGDEIALKIVADSNGRVVGYGANREQEPVKRVAGNWESIPEPKPPADIESEEHLRKFISEVEGYMAEVSKLRAREFERWRESDRMG